MKMKELHEQKKLEREEIDFANFLVNSAMDYLRPDLIGRIMNIDSSTHSVESMRLACVEIVKEMVRHETSTTDNPKITTEVVDL